MGAPCGLFWGQCIEGSDLFVTSRGTTMKVREVKQKGVRNKPKIPAVKKQNLPDSTEDLINLCKRYCLKRGAAGVSVVWDKQPRLPAAFQSRGCYCKTVKPQRSVKRWAACVSAALDGCPAPPAGKKGDGPVPPAGKEGDGPTPPPAGKEGGADGPTPPPAGKEGDDDGPTPPPAGKEGDDGPTPPAGKEGDGPTPPPAGKEDHITRRRRGRRPVGNAGPQARLRVQFSPSLSPVPRVMNWTLVPRVARSHYQSSLRHADHADRRNDRDEDHDEDDYYSEDGDHHEQEDGDFYDEGGRSYGGRDGDGTGDGDEEDGEEDDSEDTSRSFRPRNTRFSRPGKRRRGRRRRTGEGEQSHHHRRERNANGSISVTFAAVGPAEEQQVSGCFGSAAMPHCHWCGGLQHRRNNMWCC